jgi:23S rRNA pseudouridine2605 synthase
MEERLQKFLSNAGIASRRRAETLIEKGLITVNGKTAKIGDKVDPQADEIKYQGKVIKPEVTMYYLAVNKPKGYISSRFDPKKRKSAYALIPEELRSKVWSVGRLDFYTEGLMLFTNDGVLTQELAHPKYEHEKEYEVELNKEIDDPSLDKLRMGVKIGDGFLTSPAKIKVRGNKIFMTIHEGKKRQIRRMFEAVGFKVKNLKRIRINKLELADLSTGKFKAVTREEII